MKGKQTFKKSASLLFLVWLCGVAHHAIGAEQGKTLITSNIQAAYEATLALDEASAYAFIKQERAARPENPASAWAQAMVLTAKQLFYGDPANKEVHLEKLERCARELNRHSNEALASNMEAQIYLAIAAIRGQNEEWLQAGRAARAALLCTQKAMKFSPNAYETQINYGILQTLLGLVPSEYRWLTKLVGLEGSVFEGEKLCLTALSKEGAANKPFALSAIALLVYRPLYQGENYKLSLNRRTQKLGNQTLAIPLALAAHSAVACHSYVSAHINITKLYTYNGSTFICQTKALYFLGSNQPKEAADAIDCALSGATKSNKNTMLWLTVVAHSLQQKAKTPIREAVQAMDTTGKTYKAEKLTIAKLLNYDSATLKIMHARLLTDAGNERDAAILLNQIQPKQLPAWQQADYYYRLGKAYEQSESFLSAEKEYLKSATLSSKTPGTYYSSYAALRLGIMYVRTKKVDTAKKYFALALAHPKNPYKATVERKADYWKRTMYK